MEATIEVTGPQILLRTTGPARVRELLSRAGAEVCAIAPDALIRNGISAERTVALRSGHAIPFTGMPARHVSPEQAYLDLSADGVEYEARR